MEGLGDHRKDGVKLEISFPKSSEDHRLQLVEINGAVFAILYAPLESVGPIRLYCEKWSLVIMAPLKSESNILVSATNVICLSEIVSAKGNVNVHASHLLVKFADLFRPRERVSEMGERGEYELNDDPGFLIYIYRLFEGIVQKVSDPNPQTLAHGQQQFLSALCAIADKIEKKEGGLDLRQVLQIWGIPTTVS